MATVLIFPRLVSPMNIQQRIRPPITSAQTQLPAFTMPLAAREPS